MKKVLKIIVSIIISIIITVYVAWSAFEYHWYSGIIPAKIGITYAIHFGGETGLREGCGAAIFRLSNATADAIDREGLDFFNDVIYSRKSKERRYTYSSWKETPVPDSWTSEVSWPGLGCSGASHSLLSKILEAASKKGSYYSSKDEGEILVIPNRKLLVFTYFG